MMTANHRREDYSTINFEETELRLGLPGGCNGNEAVVAAEMNNNGKRGFSETENATTTIDLKLNLSSTANSKDADESSSEVVVDQQTVENNKDKSDAAAADHSYKPPAAKAQVVGWPPVRSYRKNIMTAQMTTTRATTSSHEKKPITENNAPATPKAATASSSCVPTAAAFVKVSLDGAPYLRKVDLKLYNSYKELAEALGKMFSSFTIGNCGSQGTKDFMSESKLIDLLNGSEYVPTYEDKDGDWMLVGDIPWGVFVDSCKRLRIMKGSEAIGLAPRAVEKCKAGAKEKQKTTLKSS